MASHPIQWAVTGGVIVADLVGLLLINRYKARSGGEAGTSWRWHHKRWMYHALLAALVGSASWLDVHYPIGAYLILVKVYAMAFPIGLLDLYFSETKGVPFKVVAGASLWCSTTLLRQVLVDATWPNGGAGVPLGIVREATARTAAIEFLRYACMLPVVGLLSDLIFSPMHRLAHAPAIYKWNHKTHHEYTNKLTALVLYHGALLDDFLMPASTIVGGFLYMWFLGLAGLQAEAFSNVGSYLIVCNTLMSHAHDVRCARLMAPLPDSLNFVAYHYVHHLSPCNNFGLTEPSDLLWDRVLGVRTIRKLEEFVKAD